MSGVEWEKKPKEKKETFLDAVKRDARERSGVPLEDVRVYYGSSEPERFGALAYTQGNEIYLGPGQEKHIGHEIWHAVQQKQGRVKAENYGGIAANFDENLEREAEAFDRKWSGLYGDFGGEMQEGEAAQEKEGPVQCLLGQSRAVRNPEARGSRLAFFNPVMKNYAPPSTLRSSTLLHAMLNGEDLQSAWSFQGEHAEGYLCEFLIRIEGALAVKNRSLLSSEKERQVYDMLERDERRELSIVLSSSPCTSNPALGGTKDGGGEGCLERLIKLHNDYRYNIHIIANNWYKRKDNHVGYPDGVTIEIQNSPQDEAPEGFSESLYQEFIDFGGKTRQF